MIYLITGVPGSGKTLYAVSTLVKSLGEQKLEKNGVEIKRRIVVDGIPNLLMPHDLMAPMIEDDRGNFTSEGDSLLTWPKWCKPGDVLVIDEIQRYWRPRGMGMKPPEMIKALETHRHMGVDFVIVTQNPMLIDQNVRRLVGRHQHIRRLLGMQRAVIYDWDGCSVDVHRTKTATTSFWNYPKSAYALYKSSELHTKQKQKIPAWLVVPVLAIVGGLFVAPSAFSTLSGAMSGKGITKTVTASAPVSGAVTQAQPLLSAPGGTVSAPVSIPVVQSSLVQPARPIGCISTATRCTCFDQAGLKVALPDHQCRAGSKENGFVLPGGNVVQPAAV